MSVSLAMPDVIAGEEGDGDADVITMDAFSTNPVIEAKKAAVPSSIPAALLVFAIRCGGGTRGLVFSILCGLGAGSCGTCSGGFGF
jgi:hypothetical protein